MSLFVSRSVRRRYGLSAELFERDGRLRLETPEEARLLAERLQSSAAEAPSEEAAASDDDLTIEAGQLNALSVLGDILKVTLERLLRRDPAVLSRILERLDRRLGGERVTAALDAFADTFLFQPTPAVIDSAPEADAGRQSSAAERTGRLGGLILFWVTQLNAPPGLVREILVGDEPLESSLWAGLVAESLSALEEESGERGEHSLLPLLRRPILAGSTAGERLASARSERQLDRTPTISRRITVGLDILAEELRPRFPPGPGPLELPSFEEEGEARFAVDRDWMPALVLVAKNARVWLHQLAVEHRREVERLDQIPDSELAELARRGITGLWLIGIWERSPASQRIKRLCGNPEAGASAYAIRAYRVAEALGGEAALDRLRRRAGRHGIRLGADMVANHTAIDSEWVAHHPERFLSLPRPPFPSYGFEGPDLSDDPAFSVHLEQHYYDRSDAAVVFRRRDRATGEVRYLYHGNDGTTVPWNDTAQLDYLNPETRTAVLESIVEVARRFPILRFDAAMTLTRHHYQRLWHPAPGDAGAIPSRAEHGLEKGSFAKLMPEEFWREVVERVGQQAPDTLLLAEAFWLTENFFVRTLGMHRVYNSAFMNMIREGENRMFRELLDRTLQHDPRVLERQVNFLSNPDERTAIDQFGSDDRYFGACMLLATLPGTPMLGHGQIEGFHERYGMEYERSYRDELPDPELVERHEREIFPLLRRRRAFATAAGFRIYEARDARGGLLEDLIAFSNDADGVRSLVLFNNGAADCGGWIRRSRPVAAVGEREAEPPSAASESLLEALGVTEDGGEYLVYRDLISGLERIHRLADLRRQGFEVKLRPYGYALLTLFRQLEDDDQRLLEQLERKLEGKGVDDLVAARLLLAQRPLAGKLAKLVVMGLGEHREGHSVLPGELRGEDDRLRALDLARGLLEGLARTAPGNVEIESALKVFEDRLGRLAGWPAIARGEVGPEATGFRITEARAAQLGRKLWIWAITEMLASAGPAGGPLRPEIWNVEEQLVASLVPHADESSVRRLMDLLRIAHDRGWGGPNCDPSSDAVSSWLDAEEVARFVGMRRSGGRQLLSRSRLLELIDLRSTLALLAMGRDDGERGRAEIWHRRCRRIAALAGC